ncbi:MAG TPA: hypothetical protein PLD25_09505 [Chloroflexota bacterium]|nr:hypothetical protein [Chloroflexota bacterium]
MAEPFFSWLALGLILLLGLVPGWLVVWWLGETRPLANFAWLEKTFVALTAGLVIMGWVAVLLVEFGLYSLTLLLICWVGISLLLIVAIYKRDGAFVLPEFQWRAALAVRESGWWERPFLLILLLAAGWLFLRPHQYITGAGDAGVYVNLGAHIAQNGRLLVYDEALAELDPTLRDVVLRPIRNPVVASYFLPAFYVTDVASGELTPQFYPLHPVWYAVAYGLGGVQSALRLTGLWALLASLAVYLFVRQISRWEVAALALVGLTLNAMQVWFARYPTSEPLTQFLLWAGLWATAVWLTESQADLTGFLKPVRSLRDRSPARLWAGLAGASLGSLFLVRIDTLFVLPVLALVVVWQWRRQQPGLVWFALPLTILVIHSLVHALWQSQPYFFDLYNYAILSLTRGQNGLIVLTLVGLTGLGLFAWFYAPIMGMLEKYRRPLLILSIVLLLALAVYGWFVRPYTAPPLTYNDLFSAGELPKLDHENLLRLGWYLSPLGVWLGVAGICLLVWRVNWQTAVMLLITLFYTLFFIWTIRNNPTQIYAMRRYVPATLPLFIVGGSYLIGSLFFRNPLPFIRKPITDHRLRITDYGLPITAVLLALLWLGSMAWSARGFISRVDYVGLPEQVAALAAQLDENAVILWNDQSVIGLGDQLGAPLKFQYGIEPLILRNLEALDETALVNAIKEWQNSGRAVYWVGDPTWLEAQQMPFHETSVTITSDYLEATTERKPTAIVPLVWSLRLSKVENP